MSFLVYFLLAAILKEALAVNTFLATLELYAHTMNQTKCWVCAAVPEHSQGGIPFTSHPLLLNGTNKPVGNCVLSSSIHNKPVSLTLSFPATGDVCLSQKGNLPVGESTCNHTITIITYPNGTRQYKNLLPDGSYGHTIWSGLFTDYSSTCFAPNHTYFICGHQAYRWLPQGWSGRCYVGYILPSIRHYLNLPKEKFRHTRAISETERFFSILIPSYGTAHTIKEIRALATLIEKLANKTSGSLLALSTEEAATRVVALQNRMALDYLLASKGGVCALVGKECCVFIPDNSAIIQQNAKDIL
nr:PREDICTED: endogenous retrovirus group PABLB member 1 Env polyprotein-like [Latimeria chalumnae]|eukprot:XP_014339620.1 PREDICTED: endogenous retrovirus group PABLB member 1 Env polyprotein-like [Latimeria chalumnae]